MTIKFGHEEQYFWLEKEYKNFLQLGADGEFEMLVFDRGVFGVIVEDFRFISDPKVVDHGIPHIMFFGSFKQYYVMVMSKTGPTLHDLWHDANLKLEMNAVAEIATKAVSFFQIKSYISRRQNRSGSSSRSDVRFFRPALFLLTKLPFFLIILAILGF